MADWQLTTLRALGLTGQGLADSAPPVPAPLSPAAPAAPGSASFTPHDPLTAPPAPHTAPPPPGEQASGLIGVHTEQNTASAPRDPLTAPPEQAAPPVPSDQASGLAGAYTAQGTAPAPLDPLTASPAPLEQTTPPPPGEQASGLAGAYTAQSVAPASHDPLTAPPASPEQAAPPAPGDQASSLASAYAAQHGALASPEQAAPPTPGDQAGGLASAYAGQAPPLPPGDQAGAYAAQHVPPASPEQAVSPVPGDQAGAYAQHGAPVPHEQFAPQAPGGQAGAYAGQNVPFAASNVPGAGVPPVHGAYQALPPGEAVWTQGANQSVSPIVGELMRRARHGDPLARRVGRGVRRAVGARAAQTVREQEAAAAILGQVVSSCRRIAVTSLRGGAGKTTVAALVARTIATHRTDRTLVVDADPSLGSLPLRLGVNAERAYRGLTTLPNWEAAQSYLTQAGERLWVASASASFALSQELDLAELQTALGEFSRYFGITLIDCGPGLTSELHEGILSSSHAQILIAPATVDGALSTRSALDWFLRGPHAHLLQRTVVVLVTHTPHVDGDLNRSRALLAAEGVPVIHLPYDRHLAAGTALDSDLLAETSQATAVHLATAAFTRANA